MWDHGVIKRNGLTVNAIIFKQAGWYTFFLFIVLTVKKLFEYGVQIYWLLYDYYSDSSIVMNFRWGERTPMASTSCHRENLTALKTDCVRGPNYYNVYNCFIISQVESLPPSRFILPNKSIQHSLHFLFITSIVAHLIVA